MLLKSQNYVSWKLDIFSEVVLLDLENRVYFVYSTCVLSEVNTVYTPAALLPRTLPRHYLGPGVPARSSGDRRGEVWVSGEGLSSSSSSTTSSPSVCLSAFLPPHSWQRQNRTDHEIRGSRLRGASCRLGDSRRRLLRGFGRASRSCSRVRFWPQGDMRTGVRTLGRVHPQQHMLLRQGLRGRDLPVWWRYQVSLFHICQSLFLHASKKWSTFWKDAVLDVGIGIFSVPYKNL